ncbi:MAG TPA: single-stranded DNA-binding protein [Verrucomicrobiae bacterium]|nr:single-stranded DNA-binding protein [Verrucomicrobiae bacterium]
MASYNKVLLMGNLTRDPEVRYTPKGTAIANVGIAVNRRWTTETGEQKEEVTFVDIEVWGRQAETVGQYMSKGKPIFVEGRLKLDSWDDKETGQKKSKLKVVCERFQFIGAAGGGRQEFKDEAPSDEGAARPASRGGRPSAPPAREPSEEATPTGDDDNIPF